MTYKRSKRNQPNEDPYAVFDELDGKHPWQEHVPEGYISYPVRKLGMGKVGYFNFVLAKEMGLIPEDHPNKLNLDLKKKIIDTFSVRIINEYDQQNNKKYSQRMIKENTFMSSRYLQLQHSNKKGKTSGDGRGIWNGIICHKGKTWDVSSRGTGVTALAPGAVQAGVPLESGNRDYGYGCGLAEIDELYSGLILSEIFHSYDVVTERTLAVIDFDDGFGVGVRAGPNLLRPAHLFLYLKQEDLSALKRATDFLISRQYSNGDWKFSSKHPKRYEKLLDVICESFASFAAQLEREYIFTWMDWDGDNILARAGIIDYGSVRLFGLRHDQYRYNDEDRYSTNLNEQRAKAKLTVQIFIQMVDYLNTSEKKPLSHYNQHPLLKKFDCVFEHEIHSYFLKQLGLKPTWIKKVMDQKPRLLKSLYGSYVKLESMKVKRKLRKTVDGVNRPPKFNLRNLIRELPQHLREKGHPIETQQLFEMILSSHVTRVDKRLTAPIRRHIDNFQSDYLALLDVIIHSTKGHPIDDLNKKKSHILQDIAERASIYNRPDRVTGNALIIIVETLLKSKKRGLKHMELQSIIDMFIAKQSFGPRGRQGHLQLISSKQGKSLSKKESRLMKRVLNILQDHSEDI